MFAKSPPTYTTPPAAASAYTVPSGLGAHGDTERFDTMWATFVRGWPPTEVKLPPTYQPPAPSPMTVWIVPVIIAPTILGNPAAGRPLDTSKGTPHPLERSTRLKLPPT